MKFSFLKYIYFTTYIFNIIHIAFTSYNRSDQNIHKTKSSIHPKSQILLEIPYSKFNKPLETHLNPQYKKLIMIPIQRTAWPGIIIRISNSGRFPPKISMHMKSRESCSAAAFSFPAD